MAVYTPSKNDEADQRPLCFFLVEGGIKEVLVNLYLAKYLNRYGIVCFLVDYRVKSRHQTTPIECKRCQICIDTLEHTTKSLI